MLGTEAILAWVTYTGFMFHHYSKNKYYTNL